MAAASAAASFDLAMARLWEASSSSGFKVIATSLDDKIIESIEHETFPNVFGVQFHPEYRKLWDTTPEFKIAPQDPDMFGYRTFLEANPPSFEFHKKLWTWFFTKVKGAESAS